MKKTALALAGVLLLASMGFAQSAAPSPAQPQAATQAQLTKVTGKLELIQGVVGLKSGGKSYLIPKIQRLAGFVKGVEEGATVTVEGYERALPYTSDTVFFMATKLTVGGKDYDLGGVGANAWGCKGMMQGGRGMMRGQRW
jgi:hypothetical protein